MPVHVDDNDGVRVVTIDNRSRANALSWEIMADLGEAFGSALEDSGVRVIVLTAAGDRHFCAGMDLKSAGPPAGASAGGRDVRLFSEQFYPKPVIGAVNGVAAGGGLGLVLACDIIVAVEDARFGIPEVRRGLIGAGVVSRAATRLHPGAVMELALTGELIDAARALELGIVGRITSREELMPTALRLAARIAANAPLAVAATKDVVYEVASLGRVDMPALRARVAHVATSADAQEGRRAFAEGRQPVFLGE